MQSRKASDNPKSKTRTDSDFPKSIHKKSSPSHAKGAESALLEEEISFAELSDGSLVETIEDPDDSSCSALAVFKYGRTRVVRRLVYMNKLLVPVPRTAVALSEMRLPCGVTPYRSRVRLFFRIRRLLDWTVDLPSEFISVLGSIALYSWFADRLPTAVYLSIIGLPQSGKSTLLEVLSLICRRPVLVSNISNAALYETCGRLHPTFLIDEVDWNSSSATNTMRQLLRAGTGPSAQVLRVGRSTDSFGPKVFCSLNPCPDQALASRCIQIMMTESGKDGLLKPSDPPHV